MKEKIKNKILEKSGSYNYYKNHYETLKNQNEKKDRKINELNDELEKKDKIINEFQNNEKDYFSNKSVESSNSSFLIYPENEYTMFSDEKLINDYEYTFSIIIPSFNSEKYLDQCLDSIIKQTINFKENIQVILIDDESKDFSKNIILQYQKLYPNNIFVYSQKHQGQSVARNTGIKHSKGKYINFLDSDDYLAINCLEEVYKFFQENEDQVDVVSIPIKHFGRKNDDDYFNNKFKLNESILNLNEYADYPQFYVSSTFIKSEVIKGNNYLFEEKLRFLEDTLFINKILLEKKKLGLIDSTIYYHRKRLDFTSKKDEMFRDTSYYTEEFEESILKLIEYCNNEEKIPLFIQNLILHIIANIVNNLDENIFKDDENLKLRLNITHILENIDTETITSNNFIDNQTKSIIIYLKNNETKTINISEDNEILLKSDEFTIDTLNNRKVYLKDISVNEEKLRINCFICSNFDNEFLKLKIIKEYDDFKEEFDCKPTSIDKKSFLNIEWFYRYNFVVDIPLNKNDVVNCYFNIIFENENEKRIIKPEISNNKNNALIENDEILLNPHLIRFEKDYFSIERGYNFSIIIAVYNTGKYLYETIDSLIEQDLSFEENVQLILVDDGSEDNSKEICLEYQKQYPENIIVLSQKNSGQAVARNNGLNYVKGKYVNFLDSDDYLSKNTLDTVLRFFNNHQKEIDMVAMPIKMFGRLNKYHILQGKFHRERVIDLNVEPNNPQLSASSAFFKKNLFPKFKFAEDMITSEDSIMINKILLEKQKYGVINSATYYYRKRFDSSSTIDNSIRQKEFYTEKIKNYFMALEEYSFAKLGKIPLFIQYLIAYDIQWLLKEPELELLNEEEREDFINQVKYVISKLDEQVIFNNEFVTNDVFKNFFYYLMKGNYDIIPKKDTVEIYLGNRRIDNLKIHSFWIDIVEIKDNLLNISGLLSSYFNHENIEITAVKEDYNGNIISTHTGKRVEYTANPNVKFLGYDWQYKYYFDLNIPIENNEKSIINLYANYHGNNSDDVISCKLNVNFKKYCRISKKSNYIAKDSHILSFQNNSFKLEGYRYKKLRKFEQKACEIIAKEKPFEYESLLKLRKYYSILYYIKTKFYKKPIYLFMDRTNHADDNAEHLFRYAVKQNDNIKKFFVVGNDSELSNINKVGSALKYNSFKHRLVYLLADKVISSHPDEYVLNPFFEVGEDQRDYMNSLITSETYFLQHGATLGNVSDWLRKYDKNISLLVTISDKEHDSFLEKGYNYDENIIQTLGFPRYDNLSNNPKKQILIIPTWRNYLENSEEIFKNSSYFNNICNLLNNKELINNLKGKGYKIVFKPHPRLENKIHNSEKRFIDLFDIDDEIIISKNQSYQELFRDSDILITDYSSVAFDFAYLKKPIIYFQPNDDYHHGKGYFDFETMGFGEVIEDKEQLFNKIDYYLNNDFKMEDKYVERVNEFFKFTDKNNCERVYNWIKEH